MRKAVLFCLAVAVLAVGCIFVDENTSVRECDLSQLEQWDVRNGTPSMAAIDGQDGIRLCPPSSENGPTGDYVLWVFPTGQGSGVITVDLDVWLGGSERGLVISLMGSPQGHDDWLQKHYRVVTNYSTAAVYLAFEQGQVRYFAEKDLAWNNITSVNVCEWTDFQLRVDLDERYFEVCKEGEFVGNGAFRREDISSISAVGLLIYQGAKPAKEAYVANVRVSMGND
jgi:hypothetical protein